MEKYRLYLYVDSKFHSLNEVYNSKIEEHNTNLYDNENPHKDSGFDLYNPEEYEMKVNDRATNITGTVAKPSNPSVKFTAFEAPIITNKPKGIKKIPGDYLEDKSYIIVIGLEQKLIGLKKLLKVLL